MHGVGLRRFEVRESGKRASRAKSWHSFAFSLTLSINLPSKGQLFRAMRVCEPWPELYRGTESDDLLPRNPNSYQPLG